MEKELTLKERAELKVKCYQATAMTASKVGLSQGSALDIAKKAYEWAVEIPVVKKTASSEATK